MSAQYTYGLMAFFLVVATNVQGQHNVTISLTGYEIPRAAAPALLFVQPAKMDAASLLQKLAAMQAQGTAKVVKFGSASGGSGMLMKSNAADGGFKAECLIKPDSTIIGVSIAAHLGTAEITSATGATMNSIGLLGTFDLRDNDKVTMVFFRVSPTRQAN